MKSLSLRLAVSLLAANLLLTLNSGCAYAQEAPGVFLVKPYLQMGNAPASPQSLTILWHTDDIEANWSVETRATAREAWKPAGAASLRRITIAGVAPHRVYSVALSGLKPGARFAYRVLKAAQPVFEAQAQARKSAKQPYRFVVFGDCAQGTPGQRAIAYQTWRQKPDFVFITGDIVYGRGRVSEYRERYFPVYNADEAAPTKGAPLIRSTLFVAAPGNHDIENPNLEKYPDALAYFCYWAQPLNGPLGAVGAPNTPAPKGPQENIQAFLSSAGENFPRMANFSFDYGNAHWTVLDSCHHADWTDAALRAWVERDLKAAQKATWRFVAFHHPPFNSSPSHFEDQWMRLLADLFEKYQVDVVWAGHVHNYQRSYPLRFVAKKGANGKWVGAEGEVAGDWTLDRTYDGKTVTRPDGVLYIVTGGGGAGLYNADIQNFQDRWHPFTFKYVADTHSLTCADIQGETLTVRQISEEGAEVDRWILTKR